MLLYGKKAIHGREEEAGESNLVEVRKGGGWCLVRDGGWGVGIIFSRY